MAKVRNAIAITLGVLGATPALAASPRAACSAATSAVELVRCISENDPDVRLSEALFDEASALPEVAGQRPNPELALEGVIGRGEGDGGYEAEIALAQSLELGGGRAARVREAETQKRQAAIRRDQARSEAGAAAVLKLHRARQLQEERAALVEALDTFDRLAADYRRRPRLTPEQEVAASVFGMAGSDYALKLAALEEEESSLTAYFHRVAGVSLAALRPRLPRSVARWPAIEEREPAALPGSLALDQAKAEVGLAQAGLESARAAAFPELTLGPMVKLQSEGGVRQQLYGLQLRFPLPLLQANGAGKTLAARGLSRAEQNLSLMQEAEKRQYEELQEVYRNATRALQRALPSAEITKRHLRTEKLFAQGLVSGALVIEAHRQAVDLEKSRNERELRAIEAWLSLRKLRQAPLTEAALKEVL